MSDEVEKIMSSGDGVVVLTGPARSGKTAAAIELYLRCSDETGRPGCLLIVPNAPAVAQAKSLLLERTDGVLVAPAVTTFARLAGSILASAEKSPATLSRHRRLLLLERIIAELHADGQFRAVGPLVDTPGLTGVLDASIAELKRAAVEPDMLDSAIDRRSARDADLLAVYRRYQKHLLDTGLFDVEGQMWLARDVLAGDEEASLGYDNITAVAADGFTDFTPTQLEMLALLGRRMHKVLITLPLVNDSRGRLWFWTARTLERIHKAIPDARVINTDSEHEPLRTLFDLTGKSTEAGWHGQVEDLAVGGDGTAKFPLRSNLTVPPTDRFSITVLESPDIEAEVRAVARAVKADLVTGAPPGSVAVVARNLDAYSEPIERIFAAHSIGVRPLPVCLDACGPVRYILALPALPGEYESHDVLAVIKNSYFRPEALGEFDAGTVAAAEMTIRAANVLGGRDSYAKAFARLGRRAHAAGDEFTVETIELGPLTFDANAIEQASGMIEALLEQLDKLSSAADAGEYVEAVRSLINQLAVPAAATEHQDDWLIASDLRALRAFDELLTDVASADPPVEQMSEVISRAAAEALCPPARTDAVVAVMDALDARPMRFKHLYLLGVNEKTFPQLSFDRCFISESDRAAWAERGVVLDRRSDLIGREMLLFYLAATRADETLTVSYLASDGTGGPGTFVDEIISAAGREGITVTRKHIGPGQFVPPADEIACPADAFNAAISVAFDGWHGQSGAQRKIGRVIEHSTAKLRSASLDRATQLSGWVAKHYGEILRRASFGLVAAHRRWAKGEPDVFDGRIDSPELLKVLTQCIPAEWVFSASELNSYAGCPWQFFARYLLGLKPLVVPAAQLAPADRGLFCHAVLWRVMTTLASRGDGQVDLAEIDPDELTATLAKACQAEKQRLADKAVYSQLWDAQTAYWQRMLADYLLDQREASGQRGARSLYFELGFGLPQRRDEDADAASRPEPVELEAGEYRIRLAGRIDRVDRIFADDEEALLAVDYKTGQLPAGKDMVDYRDLQLALYAKALEAMFDTQCTGGAYHDLRNNKHRYFAAFKTPQVRGRPKQEYEELLAGAMEAVGLYVQAMRDGRFDAIPSGKCSKWCPYRQICHYSPARANRKVSDE